MNVRVFKTYVPDNFSSDIAQVPWQAFDFSSDIDEKVATFNNLFLDVLNQHAPVKQITVKAKPIPFMTSELLLQINERNRLLKVARSTRNILDWEIYKSSRRQVKSSLRKAESEYVKNEITTNKGNSNALWKTIRQCLPKDRPADRVSQKPPEVLADDLNTYFVNVGRDVAIKATEMLSKFKLPIPDEEPHTICEDVFEFQLITASYVSQLIDELLLNKSPGIDKIPAKVVKDCKIHIVDQLANLINCSLQTCTFPSAWKLAEVIPLMKNDLDAEKGPNNRPISLLPILSKLCERVAYLQLTTFSTGRGKLSKHQSGNKKLYSTETLNILTTDYIIDQMDKKNLTAMVLIDLSKAFDGISHDILLQKLIKFDISSSAIKWFKSYLEERFQSVRIGNHLSDPKLITHGVPQGSILGPLLFSLYVNDLSTIPKSANTESYVDDTKLFMSVNWNNLDNGLKELKWEAILNSLVFSKLYFSSTVWSNTTKRNVAKLQQVQNFAARIMDNKKFEHITPTLKALKWLPVSDKLVLNDAIMTYKCMNGQAPSYLCSKIINMCEQTHRYNTRFQSSDKIKQQLCRTSTGQRSFLVRAINLWNYSIENNIQKENLSIFKKQFRTILLNKFLDS